MYKKFAVLLFCLFAFSGLQAEEEYVFKAKGEFAKELKALMEKYEKEGKVEIQEVKENDNYQTETVSIVDAFLNNEQTSGDIAFGKSIYDKNCYKCHGQQAAKSKYPNARPLISLKKKELIEQIENYSSNADYGGSTKLLMHQSVVGMTTPQIVSVSAYIYSIKNSKEEATAPINETKEESSSETPSTYLQ